MESDNKTTAEAELPSADLSGLLEIDSGCIVRPERFIRPELSGIAVPLLTVNADKPIRRWQQLLRWSDGRRERRAMAPSIELPENRRLWIHPVPVDPSTTMQQGWSLDSRTAWLAGAAAPGPEEVYMRLCERIAYYIDLPQQHAPGITCTLALWVLLTYVFPAWPALPYLYVGGPLGSGKSRVFEILGQLVFRALASSNMTAPALFRTLHNYGGSLLLDEAERLKQTGSSDVGELLSMLLAGYKHGGQATRLEKMGDTFSTTSFDVYGPKALACIAGLPPALASRCITLSMFRAGPNSEKPRRRINETPARWQALRDDLHLLAMEHGPTWLELSNKTDVCPRMSGRDFELWQPLLALAWWIESHGARGLHKLLEDHALATIDRGRDDTTPDADETLLQILAEAVLSSEWLTAQEILTRAVEAEPTVFKNWQPKGVANRLKAYGIPRAKKTGSRREYRDVTPEMLRRIQTHYGIDLDFPEHGNADTAEPSPIVPTVPNRHFPREIWP